MQHSTSLICSTLVGGPLLLTNSFCDYNIFLKKTRLVSINRQNMSLFSNLMFIEFVEHWEVDTVLNACDDVTNQ